MLKLSIIVAFCTVLCGCAGYVKHYNATVNAPKTPHQYANEVYWAVLSRGGGFDSATNAYTQAYQRMLIVCAQQRGLCK